ncbi:hypothetical protein LJR230_003409 [Trinickia sp. LjRoot230]|uniref:hypothetical protein n=1 Tax=Trinickia sp. LjRoot230 TaxID=3342288 RepID=UPI003ECC60F8
MVRNTDGHSASVKAREREQYERAGAAASGGSAGGSGCAFSMVTKPASGMREIR